MAGRVDQTVKNNRPRHPFRRFLYGAVLIIAIVMAMLFAVTNRQPVAFNFFPLPWFVEWPLYGLVFATFVFGALCGMIGTWWHQRIWRRRARALRAENIKLNSSPKNLSEGG